MVKDQKVLSQPISLDFSLNILLLQFVLCWNIWSKCFLSYASWPTLQSTSVVTIITRGKRRYSQFTCGPEYHPIFCTIVTFFTLVLILGMTVCCAYFQTFNRRTCKNTHTTFVYSLCLSHVIIQHSNIICFKLTFFIFQYWFGGRTIYILN